MEGSLKLGPQADVSQLERERDLYLRLLNLGSRDRLEPFLEEALSLVTQVIGAEQGYLELSPVDDRSASPRWSVAHGFSEEDLEGVRRTLSRGIIASAIQTGDTVVTRSALRDGIKNCQEAYRACVQACPPPQ